MKLTGYTYQPNKNLNINFKYLYTLDGVALPVDNSGNATLPDYAQSIKDLFDSNKLDLVLYCDGEFLQTWNIVKIGDFVDYLINTDKTGIYIDGGNCGKLLNEFVEDYPYITDVTTKMFSEYIEKEIVISDPVILQKLSGKPFQLNFKPNYPEYKAILLENFDITTQKYKTNEINTIYSSNIGFELDKVVDNKKSWTIGNKIYDFDNIDTLTFTNGNKLNFEFNNNTNLTLYTPFLYNPTTVSDYGLTPEKTFLYVTTTGTTSGTTYYDILDFFDDENGKIEHIYSLKGNPYYSNGNYNITLRDTNYSADDDRLILNSKEVTLGCEVNKFLDRQILLSIWKDSRLNNSYSDLFDINNFETFDDFVFYINNNFGNALTYKTINVNEWLVKLLDIYLQRTIDNPLSGGTPIYNPNYNIQYIIGVINQIDDKWFNMLENVVPSTMIWEYVKLLKNGFIQTNKFNYKRSNISLKTDVCTNKLETLTGTTLNTIVIEDTTSDYLTIKNTYKNKEVLIQSLNYNQMFGGYYYYGDNSNNVVYNDEYSVELRKTNCGEIDGIIITGAISEFIVPPNTTSGCTKEIANLNAIDYATLYGQDSVNLTGSCLIYWNDEQSMIFSKDDCGTISGCTISGVPTELYVSGHTYSGATLEQANQFAIDDLIINGQSIINASGECLIYYNEVITTAITKNDCGEGYTGTTTELTILTGTTSGCTQEQANENALIWGQEYVNNNGSCVSNINTGNTIEFIGNASVTSVSGSTLEYWADGVFLGYIFNETVVGGGSVSVEIIGDTEKLRVDTPWSVDNLYLNCNTLTTINDSTGDIDYTTTTITTNGGISVTGLIMGNEGGSTLNIDDNFMDLNTNFPNLISFDFYSNASQTYICTIPPTTTHFYLGESSISDFISTYNIYGSSSSGRWDNGVGPEVWGDDDGNNLTYLPSSGKYAIPTSGTYYFSGIAKTFNLGYV